MEYDLAEKIRDITGENVYKCISCARCTAVCPVAIFMDYLPHQVIHLIRLNDKKILDSKAIWYCVSCMYCTERCPRNIDVAKIMESLRAINLRQRKDAVKLREVKELKELPPMALVAAGRKYTG